AMALKDFLDEFIKKSIVMVFGSMRDKDLSKIAQILFPKAEKLIFTSPDNERSMKAEELLEFLPENFPREKVFVSENVEKALIIGNEISSDNDLICVTGSLYLVGEVQKLLNKE